MSSGCTALYVAAAVWLTLPLLVFCLEVLVGLVRQGAGSALPDPPPFVVLVPAHDEAKGIAATVAHIRASLRSSDRLMVVADNCSDDTATIARAAHAEVLERHDPARRGKGYALAHGVAALAAGEHSAIPTCVIIVDADCTPEPAALMRLAARATATGRPVQAAYLMRPDAAAGPVTRLSNFAFMLKNRVRQRGMSRLGGTCVLTGSGMALPWPLLAVADLANGEIVEDLVLGLRLTESGKPPLFDDAAVVWSDPAPSDAETAKQRRRWEHGFVSSALRFVPSLLMRGGRARRAALWTAAHLLVPPFMLLISAAVALLAIGLIGSVANVIASAAVSWVAGLTIAALLFVGLAWLRDGQAYLRPRDVVLLPRYLVAKAAIWAGFINQREASWTRTKR